MLKLNLVLVHPPSYYDFRKHPTLWGPISDLIPSSPVFDMYPIGFTTIAEYLEQNGFKVRIANLAVRMLLDPDFNVSDFIGSLDPSAFGISLHWLPHAHGALKLAQLIKRIYPNKPVIMGGLSASYFHEEIITFPYVDYVVRGDSTEEPIRRLIECIESGSKPHNLKGIPNLSWKDNRNITQINSLSYVPPELDHLLIDYSFSLRAVIRDFSISNNLPFGKWLKYPITAALTCRGCRCNCAICGGSAFSYSRFYGRTENAFRSPENLAQDLRRIRRYSRGPVFTVGDIRQAGMSYARRFLKAMQGIDKPVILEFFWPIDRGFAEEIAGAIPNFIAQLSPESHDSDVLRFSGKSFDCQSISSSIAHLLSVGCKRVDVFFMTGMPGQTYESVLDSIEYVRYLAHFFEANTRLRFFISPLAPFLDPGSLVYEMPERYGYRKFCYSLMDHFHALNAPSWKHILSYENRWMDRSQIVDVTYEAGYRLNRLKADFGLITKERAQMIEMRIVQARELMSRIDELMKANDPIMMRRHLSTLGEQIESVNNSTVCEKEELDLPVSKVPVKILQAAGLLIEDGMRSIWRRLH